MAAALIVPAAGVVSATSSGAATSDNVTCTTNTGTLKTSPGISLTTRRGTTFTAKGGELSGCTGIGIAGETTATLGLSVQRPAVNCKSIKGTTFTGSARITWGDGSNKGFVTKARLRITFTSLTSIAFNGTVSGGGYLTNAKIKGAATIPEDLKSVGNGDGKCGNSGSARVKSLDYTGTDAGLTIGVTEAAA